MNKANLARTALECCFGGGCIAGGVECAKAKGVSSSLNERNRTLETENENLKKTNNSVKGTNAYFVKENNRLKEAVKYASTWLHKLGTATDWDANKLKEEARNVKWGIKNDHLEKKGERVIELPNHRWT